MNGATFRIGLIHCMVMGILIFVAVSCNIFQSMRKPNELMSRYLLNEMLHQRNGWLSACSALHIQENCAVHIFWYMLANSSGTQKTIHGSVVIRFTFGTTKYPITSDCHGSFHMRWQILIIRVLVDYGNVKLSICWCNQCKNILHLSRCECCKTQITYNWAFNGSVGEWWQ